MLIKPQKDIDTGMPKLEHSVGNMTKQSLSEYLRLVMRQKRLSAVDVERRCNGQITNSYIGRIARGEITNLTVETIGALAEGLGVDAYDLFALSYGKPSQASQGVSTIDAVELVAVMQKLVMSPHLIEVLQVWDELSPQHRERVLASLRSFREQELKSKRNSKPPVGKN